MLVLERGGELLLEKRPAAGIWGGLWCFPELGHGENATAVSLARYGASVRAAGRLPEIRHGFTHFSLTISPQKFAVTSVVPRAAEESHRWLSIDEIMNAGIPAPVKRIVQALGE